MVSRPTNEGGGGVTPPDGYTADTGTMSGTARNISNAAEDARGEVDDIRTGLTAAEFGTKHTQHQAAYAAGIEQLGQAATAMCDSLATFAGQIGGAGQAYTGTDTGAANTVTAPRGGR